MAYSVQLVKRYYEETFLLWALVWAFLQSFPCLLWKCCMAWRERWKVSGRCILSKEISNSKTYLKMRISINKQFRERRTSEYLCLGKDFAINANIKVACPILIWLDFIEKEGVVVTDLAEAELLRPTRNLMLWDYSWFLTSGMYPTAELCMLWHVPQDWDLDSHKPWKYCWEDLKAEGSNSVQ